MQQGFWKTLLEAVSTTSGVEPEPGTGTSTKPSGSSPWVLRMHRQHATGYTKLMIENGVYLTMGDIKAAPLITEVCSSMPTS